MLGKERRYECTRLRGTKNQQALGSGTYSAEFVREHLMSVVESHRDASLLNVSVVDEVCRRLKWTDQSAVDQLKRTWMSHLGVEVPSEQKKDEAVVACSPLLNSNRTLKRRMPADIPAYLIPGPRYYGVLAPLVLKHAEEVDGYVMPLVQTSVSNEETGSISNVCVPKPPISLSKTSLGDSVLPISLKDESESDGDSGTFSDYAPEERERRKRIRLEKSTPQYKNLLRSLRNDPEVKSLTDYDPSDAELAETQNVFVGEYSKTSRFKYEGYFKFHVKSSSILRVHGKEFILPQVILRMNHDLDS